MNYYWAQTVIADMRIYLKEWLDLLGISQAELAKESGISEDQISRIASGKNRRLPRAGTLISANGLTTLPQFLMVSLPMKP